MLAGGNNNEYDSGALAVLKEEQEPASSPQTAGSSYECADCPPGRPLRYIVFPRSELNRVAGAPFNSAKFLQILPTGVQVQTEETRGDHHGSLGFYQLSSDFKLERFSLGVGYWKFHQVLEQERKVKHSVANCPDRVGPKIVREWTPETGWKEEAVPAVVPAP